MSSIHQPTDPDPDPKTFADRVIHFCLGNKLVVSLLVIFVTLWGVMVAPFDWAVPLLPRDPVPVDAIPDIGENQQIVFTDWSGRSPQDVEDQITYPLTAALLGVPEVKTIRSFSMFGFSSIYVIFREKVDFYWARSRLLERLNSLPAGSLPAGVQPKLGPDATALGQVFWYTLEGRDRDGHPTGGWDLQELRSIQDWTVRYTLLAAEGVSEVASVGGFVKEYQVDVDPDAMRAHRVTLEEVYRAVQKANLDTGARTMEINRADYIIRGVGFIKNIGDIENTVIKATGNTPIYIRNVATVSIGPALRTGALDKDGAEVVGGVVVVRHGENPLAVIKNVKRKIEEIAPSLPRKTLPDGRESQVHIVPFYDRTGLIYETLGTLDSAITEQILVTIIVVMIMLLHFSSSLLISAVLPLAVLMCFIAMRLFGVDANIVALSGIAIAIGTMVDMGIIICENIIKHLSAAQAKLDRADRQLGTDADTDPDFVPERLTLGYKDAFGIIYRASSEVGSAVVTAISTTIVSFLPVFTMQAAEGKLFKPLAFTKTFALLSSVIVALTIIPTLAHVLFAGRVKSARLRRALLAILALLGIGLGFHVAWWAGVIVALVSLIAISKAYLPPSQTSKLAKITMWLLVVLALLFLAQHWLPLGPDRGMIRNVVLVGGLVGLLIFVFHLFHKSYERILRWCLAHKLTFLSIPLLITMLGLMTWLGFEPVFGWLPRPLRLSRPISWFAHQFPGLGKEFMPPLDEGSYLFMPTLMPHASIGEALDVLQIQDRAISAIPEVETAVGKLGRADSPLDPAPIQMFETVITYHPQYLVNRDGKRLSYRFDAKATDLFRNEKGEPVPAPDGRPYTVRGRYARDDNGLLIPDPRGKPFLLWRPALDPDLNPGRETWPGIQKPNDIWDIIVAVAAVPGSTSAPRLQPIATRVVMLQSGMRAAMGIKVKGPNLPSIEQAALVLERLLKNVPMIEPSTVIADRIIGKPYVEIVLDRQVAARYGVSIEDAQMVIQTAIGGEPITTTVEGRERYPVRVRYLRELRDNMEALERILVPAMDGAQVPLIQLAHIRYVRGPDMIKSEDTFLTGYVLFDKKPDAAEVDVVQQAQEYLRGQLETGAATLPAGVSYTFAGNYENEVRATQKLLVVIPLALFIIFLILYFQFRSTLVTFFVFSGIFVAWAGGFIMIWLYGQPWFLNFSILGMNLRDLFQVHTINLSVAIWVGFLALFGIASDDGVVMATYLGQSFANLKPASRPEIREAVVRAGLRRIRPCLMTTATTILALLPVLTSTGRGADVMVPMAIPSFGGMVFELITLFVVPVLYSWKREIEWARTEHNR